MSEKEAIARGLIPDPKVKYTTQPDPIREKGDGKWYRVAMAEIENKARQIATEPVFPTSSPAPSSPRPRFYSHYEWPDIPWLAVFIVFIAGFMVGLTAGFVMAP